MNVYDFDNTIYDGESSVDFFLFCLSKKKSLIKYFPLVIYTLVLYKMNLLSETKVYKIISIFSKAIVQNKEFREVYVKEFWIKKSYKLKQEFLDKLKSGDVIITGAPDILMEGIESRFCGVKVITSKLDSSTGELKFLCFRENKVKIFRELFPNQDIEEFYTDSMSDEPMMKISKKVYMVRK